VLEQEITRFEAKHYTVENAATFRERCSVVRSALADRGSEPTRTTTTSSADPRESIVELAGASSGRASGTPMRARRQSRKS
jgi:hypothetical protein